MAQLLLFQFFDLVRKLWLFQPPSTMMAERVFSVVNYAFGAQPTTVLNDPFELTVNVAPQHGTRMDAPDPIVLVATGDGEAAKGGSLLAPEKTCISVHQHADLFVSL